jgi:tRNA1(Val) A37 N6-methylase TrmN6
MELSYDRPAPGVVIAQPRRGFRYGSEAMWLAAVAAHLRRGRALDLGTGSGVVAALLAADGWEATGVDHREEWAPAWAETLSRSRFSGTLRLVRLDVREVDVRVDLVVANPPYFPSGTGPVVADAFHRAARTEGEATLSDFVSAARRCVGGDGLIAFVVPIQRAPELAGAHVVPVGRKRCIALWGRDSRVVEAAAALACATATEASCNA